MTPLKSGTSSPQASSAPAEGLGGSGSQSATTGRGILLQQPVRIVVGLALILLVVLDLLTHVPRQNPVVSRMVFEPGLVRLSPQPRHGDGRAMISPANNLKLYRFATTNAFNDYINNRRLLFANCNLLDAIPKVNGFYSLYLRDGDAVRAFLYDSTNTPPAPLCDFLGVSHITDPENFLEWKYRPDYLPLASVGQKAVFADELTTFKEARQFASAVGSHEPTPHPCQEGNFTPDPSQEGNFTNACARGLPSSYLFSVAAGILPAVEPGILPGGIGAWFGKPLPIRTSDPGSKMPPFTAAKMAAATDVNPTLNTYPSSGGRRGGFIAGEQVRENPGVKILRANFSAHRGEIQIEAQERSWLVIAQNNYHCWRASWDGAPLRLWQANYAFQAAVVPEGQHLLKLVYRDWGFVAGTVLSVLSLIGCVAAAACRVKRGHAAG